MASIATIKIVKATAPVLAQHGETITTVFYQRLFEAHPELKDIFNMTHQQQGTQPKVLANAIFKYATYIDKLQYMSADVEAIAQKHSSLSIRKEQYPIVGKYLLAAIQEVLGTAATPEIIAAWAEAYGDLAAIFVAREEALYTEREQTKGGFRGKKEFVVVNKVKESDVITSFYLQPKDQKRVPTFTPGQYIAVSVTIPNTTHQHTRNYSISNAPGKPYLRISVKKETGDPDGMVSSYLHEQCTIGSTLHLGMPSGIFTLTPDTRPLVLISGGIGITPLLSMYHKAVQQNNRPILMIQCAIHSKVHAFHDEILKHQTPQTRNVIVYSDPLPPDEFDYEGFLTLEMVQELNISLESDFYFCGPKPFLKNTLGILHTLGIPAEQIHYEFFGPSEELTTSETTQHV